MTRRRLRGGPSVALLLLVSTPSFPQSETYNRYEAQYGTPVDVSIGDLVQNGFAYEGRAVRTSGRLDLTSGGFRSRTYTLRDSFAAAIRITPVPDVAGNFESEAPRYLGQEVQVTGVFNSDGSVQQGNQASGLLQFWSYVGPPERDKGPVTGKSVTLEALVTNLGKRDGQTVQVVGKFRGRNLYGDLPVKSQRDSADWVIKDDVYAVWVTGRKPKGDGFQLDAGLKRDTGKWIEVIGRPETKNGVTYIRALRINLTGPPTPTAQVHAPPPPPERPKTPPVVVFALPLDGESEIPPDTRFKVQFSKDMDQSSFSGRIVLRYAGPRLPGDREFDGLKVTYDEGRRALMVDPGDVLRTGRQLELLLLPGIADIDGLGLAPRPGRQVDGAADVLRYQVGG